MKNILVALDFKEQTEELLKKASEFANALGSKIWLVHIAAPDPDFVGYEVGPQHVRDDRAQELREEHKKIQEYADELVEKGVDAEGLLIQGSTIETILNEAKKMHIDLIITGHHEKGMLYQALVGSVSSSIIKTSKIPVLIVPY